MRAVIQRVSACSVSIDDQITSQIDLGLLVLLGYSPEDSDQDLQWMMDKIVNQRIFSDDEGKMNLSLHDVKGELMLVSQFTLYASTKKGNRPSFIHSADAQTAEKLYRKTVLYAQSLMGNKVRTGVFGADMQVSLTNDGPVTILMDTQNKE